MDSFTARLPDTMATDRLVLAAPTLEHVPEMAVLANNGSIFEMLSKLPHPYDESHGRTFVQTIARSDHEFAWTILLGHRLIGVIGLQLSPTDVPGLGYWLGQPFWGRGFATEAGLAVIAAARAAGVPALRARARTSNGASRKVLRKLGFVEVGEGPAPDGYHAGRPTTFMHLDLAS